MTTLDLIGSSPKFRAVMTDVERVAPVDSAVLIQGETGTGKEVIAGTIHEASRRRSQRFVALNCAAIPSALLESELFGHERGAFTGACTQTQGRFQRAEGGTLFREELGDWPVNSPPHPPQKNHRFYFPESDWGPLGGRPARQYSGTTEFPRAREALFPWLGTPSAF